VRVVTSQAYDAQRDHGDIAILFGDGHWPSCTAARLFPESVTPVCSPAFRDAHPHVARAEHLLTLPLLHVQPTRPERWLSWSGWFDAHGLDTVAAARGVTFNSYALVIHAALLGEGVALGWAPLVDELVAAGQLVKPVDAPVVTSRGYFLVRPPQRPEPDATHVFRRWLLDACASA
jgi:LysR family glycine cleavage system transcriptional activator